MGLCPRRFGSLVCFSMTIHLIKLCVGIDSIEHLRQRQFERRRQGGVLRHVTRMTPRRRTEILDDGSIYWVIKGIVQVRQAITGMELTVGGDGVARCALMLDADLIATRPQPRRAFQGWRYLRTEDAPADLPTGTWFADMPPKMRAELMQLGLI